DDTSTGAWSNTPMRIAAVVLAAGQGRRAGGPKALLRIGANTFLEQTAALLARSGADLVIAVLGHQAERVREESSLPASTVVVVNEAHADGMLASVLAGLDAADAAGADAILLHPVDHPLVSEHTVARVADALRAGALIAVPSHGGRRGHPGGFARAAWPALRAAPRSEGARHVLAAHPDWIVHVEGDRGCVAGIDTPEDYERLVGPVRGE
ncbi:MAG TPA: NTP transferase domain-containing protein, partial [Candidatus Limnocylindrales bacterium]|nr:NTP transferase domain-containing protein [Candidatus Limnocylindrales bacterium]